MRWHRLQASRSCRPKKLIHGRKVMRRVGILVAAVAGLMSAGAAEAVHWPGRQVGRILAPDTRDCVFFELVGVTEADAAVPTGGSWFAMPRGALGFKEIYSLLLLAKATGIPMTVETTGAAVGGLCG